jgi:hypothetical protein
MVWLLLARVAPDGRGRAFDDRFRAPDLADRDKPREIRNDVPEIPLDHTEDDLDRQERADQPEGAQLALAPEARIDPHQEGERADQPVYPGVAPDQREGAVEQDDIGQRAEIAETQKIAMNARGEKTSATILPIARMKTTTKAAWTNPPWISG